MILLVNKPGGMTSQRVVSSIKHANTQRLKIGHTGTLDPMCTGLLPVLTGKDTKLNDFFPHCKSYLATILFGRKTDTGDVTGETVASSQICTEEEFISVLPSMIGRHEQVPPMYSAVHVNGKRLYELAREGVEIERKARTVEITEISFVKTVAEGEFQFSVSCSSGTYIRTLCEDIAARMGLCATMSALCRTASNGFLLRDAHSLEDVIALAREGRLARISVRVEDAFSFLPRAAVADSAVRYYSNGGRIEAARLSLPEHAVGLLRAYTGDGRFLGLMSYERGFATCAFLAEEVDSVCP